VVRDAGDSACLLEFESRIDADVNARAVSAAASVRAHAIRGVRDVVATFRSVAVFFDPLNTDVQAIRQVLAEAGDAVPLADPGERVNVPVVYGGEAGPDLDAVAQWAGLSPAEVVARHAGRAYRVFMMGFLPGFAYLGTVDSTIAAPRRQSPRVRLPAGSVGIAGRQTGVYPSSSPGGWQIVGRSPLQMFDLTRGPVSLLAPRDIVRFVPTTGSPGVDGQPDKSAPPLSRGVRQVLVLRPGMFTTVQDLGRWGHQDSGVAVSGVMDSHACRCANVAVGNDPNAAVLEATLSGPELKFESPVDIAVTGANLSPSINGEEIPQNRGIQIHAGSILRFGARRGGARTYVAFDGGVASPVVLGSRSTHVGSGLGGFSGRSLRAGDRFVIGVPTGRTATRRAERALPAGGARLRVIPGPQLPAFGPDAFDALARTRFEVSPQSNRTGYRLAGPRLPDVPVDGTMVSDATFPGVIQVPPTGEPILLLADRPSTGGYPQIGVVATADLDTAGQLAPGDWVEFVPCSREEAVAALATDRVGE